MGVLLIYKERGLNRAMAYKILPLTITLPFGDTEETVYPTLLWDGDAVVLVDCGFIGALSLLEGELMRHGLTVEQVTGLVLTHHDHDHMGSAAALKRRNSRIRIYASPWEAPYISAREKPLRLQQAEALQKTLPPDQQAFGEAFCEMLRRVEPVEVDCLLEDGERLSWCGGCRVLYTPGHTPGHISLYLEQVDSVITGDAFALENGTPVLANPQFALEPVQAEVSMEKLLSMGAKAYYCSHGGIYHPGGADRE